MHYRRLGNTGLSVSEVGFGVWTLTTGWWGDHTEAESKRMLRLAFDLGVNFFDTADVYGDGRGESLLYEVLADVRDQCVFATKIGYDWYNNKRADGQREHPQDFSPRFVRYAVEQSLARLGGDRIDWLQLHNPRMTTLEQDELYGELEALKTEGMLRAWGVALGPAIGWRDEGVYAIRERATPALQVIHNLLEQEACGRWSSCDSWRGLTGRSGRRRSNGCWPSPRSPACCPTSTTKPSYASLPLQATRHR
jgi:aryl-alcohol dehydrogenase-like predicted oxidoreductase